MKKIIDLHGYTIDEAKTTLEIILSSNINKYDFVEVIHGYNNGRKIKDFLKNYKHQKISYVSQLDSGKTVFHLKKRLK